MKRYYRSPPVTLVSNDEDVYFFIDEYEEASTDPPLSILVESFVNDVMGAIQPFSKESKFYRLGSAPEHQKEIDPNDKDQLIDFYENIITTKYKDVSYELTYKERNVECGASGVTETVLLAILSGAVGGIAGTVMSKLIDIYNQDTPELADNEIYSLMHELIREKYGAKGEITCISSKKDEKVSKYTLEDENNTRFYIDFTDGKGVRSIKVRKSKGSKSFGN